MIVSVRATLMRGGTSKCWVFEADCLPAEPQARDAFLLRAMGTPDIRQIDGVGGGTSTTSKVVILSRSARPGADVDYTFAQVGTDKSQVDWLGNCGNCSAVTGPYAIHAGWVRPPGEITRVRVYNTNTNKLLLLDVPTPNGAVAEEGETMIAGVPFAGAEIRLGFYRPQGAVTRKLLPSGRAIDVAQTDIGRVRFTLVDAANPFAFARAGDLGLEGNETPAEIDGDRKLLARLEFIRGTAAVLMGLVERPQEAAGHSQAIPKIAVVAPSIEQVDLHGRRIALEAMDVSVRMLSMARTHPAFAMTGMIALAAAATIPGSTVAEMSSSTGPAIRVGHPSGVAPVWIELDAAGELEAAFVRRTARRLCAATLFVPLPAEVARRHFSHREVATVR